MSDLVIKLIELLNKNVGAYLLITFIYKLKKPKFFGFYYIF